MKYKLTNQDGRTRGDTQWGQGVTHTAEGDGTDLCSDGVIHYYDSALLAVLMNPIHAGIQNPRLWEAEGETTASDGLKGGCRSLTTLREIPLPVVTPEQRAKFGILCAMEVYHDSSWRRWARGWLDGTDRSEAAAWAAEAAVRAAAAEEAAAAARAAWAAAWAAEAEAEAWAAGAAARAARVAREADCSIDFTALAEAACEEAAT